MKKIKTVPLFSIVLLFYFVCNCQFLTYDLKARFSEKEFESVKSHISTLLIENFEETIPIIEPLVGVENASFLIPDLISLLEIKKGSDNAYCRWSEIALLLAKMPADAKEALPALYKCRDITEECMSKVKDTFAEGDSFEYYLACFDIAITSILNGHFDINYEKQQIQIAWLNYAIRLITWNVKNNVNDGTDHALELISWNTPIKFHWNNMDSLLNALMLVIEKGRESADHELALRILWKMGADAKPVLSRLERGLMLFYKEPYIKPILEETIKNIKEAEPSMEKH